MPNLFIIYFIHLLIYLVIYVFVIFIYASFYHLFVYTVFLYFSFQWLDSPLGGLGRLIVRGFTITLLDMLHSVGLLWTSDQPVAETRIYARLQLRLYSFQCYDG
jgi:hypothetical protein